MDWKIKFIPSAVKDINAIPEADASRLKRHLELFLKGLKEHDMAYLAISKVRKLMGRLSGYTD